MNRFVLLIIFTSLCLSAVLSSSADDAVDPRIALDSEFPDPDKARYFAGEITLVEHVNRQGILRLDRDGTLNKYFWDLPHSFQMLPYGAVWYKGAPAELKDIPLGTHLHGKFYLGPEGDFQVEPPVSNYFAGRMANPDMRSIVSQYSRVLLLEDDFTFYQRQGAGWKIKSISETPRQIVVERVALKDGQSDTQEGEFIGVTGEQTLRIDEGTRVWKGKEIATLENLAVGQVVQLNLGWVSLLGSFNQDGLCREIWVDEESRKLASERQRGVHLAHQRRRGIGAHIIKTESVPNEGARGYVTIQLHAGIDPVLFDEIRNSKSIFVRAAEPTLRIYDINDLKYGHELEVTEIGSPPPGSSGIQIRFHMYEMLEGFRKGRTVRVGLKEWEIPGNPREEKLNPVDLRKFSVGPKHIVDRDGPPPGVETVKESAETE